MFTAGACSIRKLALKTLLFAYSVYYGLYAEKKYKIEKKEKKSCLLRNKVIVLWIDM